MARSTYIYLVNHAATDTIYASFTVKREAHEWAYWSQYPMWTLKLHRMKDNPRETKTAALRQAIPWEQKTIDWLNEEKQEMLDRNPEGALADSLAEHVV